MSYRQDLDREFNNHLVDVLAKVRHTLVDKRNKYGPLESLNIFSDLTVIEGLKIRMDDKLRRLKQTKEDDEDTLLDFIGYATLLYIELYVQGTTIRDAGAGSRVPVQQKEGTPKLGAGNRQDSDRAGRQREAVRTAEGN